MTTSITSRQPFPSMPLEVVTAAADEAHRHGKLVLAHPTNHAGLILALRGGADVIVHTTPDSGAWDSDLVAEMRRHNVALVPTLKLWDDVGRLQGLSDSERRRFQAVGIGQLRAFVDAGGRVLFGTDVGFMTDYDPAAEYGAMNAAGLSFTRILESLTTAPARQFKQGDITGTIERGKRADIVIVEGDPATDLGALTRVTRLYCAGRPIYQATPVATDAAVERLRAIQQELINAWLAQDRPVIERLLAPDWTVTGPTGAISTRATVLADAFDRRIHRLLSGTISDLTVRMIGAVGAVVAGRTHATGTYDGVAYTAEIRFTDVFERHAGDWRAVRSHASNTAK